MNLTLIHHGTKDLHVCCRMVSSPGYLLVRMLYKRLNEITNALCKIRLALIDSVLSLHRIVKAKDNTRLLHQYVNVSDLPLR